MRRCRRTVPTRPRCRPLRSAFALAWLGLLLPTAAVAGGPPLCEGGRFLVTSPLLPGRASGGDAVEIAGGRIAIDGGCGAGAVKLRATRLGTKVKAIWKECAGQPGKVKLSGLLDASCTTLTGKLTAAKTRPRWKREFSAPLETEVRACDFVPGPTTIAAAPDATAAPLPRRRPRPNDPRFQEGMFRSIWNLVLEVYVDPKFNGVDWDAVFDEYLAKIEAGLDAEAFYDAMADLIEELGDGHSHFLDPQQVEAEEAELGGGASFIGSGVRIQRIGETRMLVVLAVHPNSPASEAGLRAHDRLIAVNGIPYLDEEGEPIELPAAGVAFELTFQRPGSPEQTVTLARRAIGSFVPLDHCLVPGTQIAYVQLLSFFDLTFPDRLRFLLEKLAAKGGIDGLVIDNRQNPGGSDSVLLPILGMFTSGNQGDFVGRDYRDPLDPSPISDVAGSQDVPLAILGGPDTVSFAEIFAGVLQHSGRAQVVGAPTEGNVERLAGFTYTPDGSVIWVADSEFEPVGLEPGVWEGVGIQPDVLAPTVWEDVTEATDPGLAAAVELLIAP